MIKRVEKFLADVESSDEPKIDDNEGEFYVTTNENHCKVLNGFLSSELAKLQYFISKSAEQDFRMPDKVLVLKNGNLLNFTFKRCTFGSPEG